MKRTIKNVLRSQTGASMSFALLLFLICTVVGALVLTAGTTAAGRIADLAEMDQRFFSVSSAANLLADEFNGQSVTITCVRKLSHEVTTAYKTEEIGGRTVVTKIPDSPLNSDQTFVGYSTQINDIKIGDEDEKELYDPDHNFGDGLPEEGISFLSRRAAVLLFDNTCNTDGAMDASMKHGNAHSCEFYLDHNRDGSDDEKLKIFGTYELKEDGTLILEIKNSDGDPYVMRVTLHAKIDESQNERSSSESTRNNNNDNSGFTEKVTTTTTRTKISKITWTVKGVEKVVSS